MKNKEGKEEARKRGMVESKNRKVEMTNKVEKETPQKNHKSGMILERFYHHSLSPHPANCSSGLKICAGGGMAVRQSL